MSLKSFGLLCVAFVALVNALGQQTIISFIESPGSLQLAGAGISGQILVSPDDYWGVIRAAGDLAEDFGRVTGHNLSLSAGNVSESAAVYTYQAPTNNVNYTVGPRQTLSGPAYTNIPGAKTIIIAGTLGHSSIIDNLVGAGKLNVSAIQGQWESFVSQIVFNPADGVEKALVVAGSDARGTVFGIYDISEQIGVSPWYFWADSYIQKQSSIFAINTIKIQGPPSVKYRGFFLNDEQPALTAYINNNWPPGKYGPGFGHQFYSTVFELLLRLRANYLWPAQWASMFNVDDYASEPLADAYAVVMGTSHTEPMMRATNEWNNFGKGAWRWDTNNQSVYPFFVYGAERTKPYINNSLITMAMRGSGDTAIPLSTQDAIKALVDVVATQQDILTNVFNNTGLTLDDIPQLWCLYKEVQGYYEAGMQVPEIITLLWTDDNWGNIRRLPLANETSRAGGAGVYYHFDYVGTPRNYKWISTINFEKTLEQMKLAYERQATRIWIVNVGDLKPLEAAINHFLDLAYDTPQFGYLSTITWLTSYATREWGPEHAASIASILDRYGLYANRRKFEQIDPTVYSVINYNEADAVLAQWSQLAEDAQTVYNALPTEAQASYFEIVLHPVLAGWTVNKIYIGAGKNWLYVEQKRNVANEVIKQALVDFAYDHNLTARYHSLLRGKWDGFMTQTHLGYDYWQQPMRQALPALAYVQTLEESVAGNMGFGIEGSNATVSGDDNYHDLSTNILTLPPMDPYGPISRYIDVFSRGIGGCPWNISTPSYVKVTPAHGFVGGSNGTDVRVLVTVPDWSTVPTSVTAVLNITTSCVWGNYAAGNFRNYGNAQIALTLNHTSVPANFTTGFVESDGHISIEAEHSTRNTSVGDVQYITIPSYGRTLSGVTLIPATAESQPAGTGPVLEYDFYSFSNISAPANITLYLSPSLNQNGAERPLKYGIALDSANPQVIQFVGNTTDGNLPDGWEDAVSNGVWATTTNHTCHPGAHTLRLWAVEPGVVFQKIMIDLGGVRDSYLGPPESFNIATDQIGTYNGTSFVS